MCHDKWTKHKLGGDHKYGSNGGDKAKERRSKTHLRP